MSFPASPGLPSQTPNRALNSVSRKVTNGFVGTHLGTDGRAGDRHRVAERQALGVRPRRAISDRTGAHMAGTDRERRALTLLRQLRGTSNEVERTVDHVQRASELGQLRHAEIIVGIEPGEAIGPPHVGWARRSDERAHDPGAIHPVQRKDVHRDAPAHHDSHREQRGEKKQRFDESTAERMNAFAGHRGRHFRGASAC